MAAPGYCDPASHEALLSNCEKCGDRVAILDAPATPENIDNLKLVALETPPKAGADEGAKSESSRQPSVAKGLRPRSSSYGALYFPSILVPDPLAAQKTVEAPPSGHICGMICRSDATRGVHKAPANEPLRGALGLSYQVTHFEQGELNRVGVNCIRYFPQAGIRVWGARTLADGDWKYINVRRLCIMIEESIRKQTLWVVFEPNDEFLWGSMKRDIKAFLTTIWRSGGLMGTKAEDAFYVKCDAETNPWESINEGKVVAEIGIAPVRPAEFVIFRIGQSANGSQREIESRV